MSVLCNGANPFNKKTKPFSCCCSYPVSRVWTGVISACVYGVVYVCASLFDRMGIIFFSIWVKNLPSPFPPRTKKKKYWKEKRSVMIRLLVFFRFLCFLHPTTRRITITFELAYETMPCAPPCAGGKKNRVCVYVWYFIIKQKHPVCVFIIFFVRTVNIDKPTLLYTYWQTPAQTNFMCGVFLTYMHYCVRFE